MKFRPDIEGLRAIAILPVVLYHFFPESMPGGFVGVDIFFVISGFLITGGIYQQITAGKFTFVRFYHRRMLRIFPALILLLAAACAAAFFLLPDDIIRFGQSLLYTSLFGANLFFWQETGYFDGLADEKLLLHIWSLSLEEQFYMLFPLLVFLLLKLNRRYLATVFWTVFIGSFLLCAVLTHRYPSASFYLLPTRMWEFMAGSAVALGLVRFPSFAGVTGVAFALFAVSFYGINPGSLFPGYLAVFPVLATVLVICMPESATVNRALSHRFFQFFGKISYSLYLWHWPVLVFVRYIHPGGVPWYLLTASAVISVLCAYLSWRFVEVPLRNNVFQWSFRRVVATFGGIFLLFAASGWTLWHSNGVPERFQPQVLRALQERTDYFARLKGTDNGRVYYAPSVPVSMDQVAVVGDSYAFALLPAFKKASQEHNVGTMAYWIPSTIPFMHTAWAGSHENAEKKDNYLRSIATDTSIGTIFLVGRWSLYYSGRSFENRHLKNRISRYGVMAGDDSEHRRFFEEGLAETLAMLQKSGKKVYIVMQPPEAKRMVTSAVARSLAYGGEADIANSREYYQQLTAPVRNVFDRLRTKYSFKVVSLEDVLCDEKSCFVSKNGIPLYTDEDHLSGYGAELLYPLILNLYQLNTSKK